MILTCKIKHSQNFDLELAKAKQIALVAKKTKTRSSKDVKQIGLPSAISNQILRKYSSNKKLKRINSVKLTIPSQCIKLEENKIKVFCIKLSLELPKQTEKIHQIELDNKYAYVSYAVKEEKEITCESWIGVDLNTTGHCVVAANPRTKKVWKLGKIANDIHKKYKNLRKKLQKRKRHKALKKIKNTESRIIRDLNHKISKKIVSEAVQNNSGIVLEELKGIRKTAKTSKKFRYALNSWSFYQLKMFIRYKASCLAYQYPRLIQNILHNSVVDVDFSAKEKERTLSVRVDTLKMLMSMRLS